jgi:hypothetical protein
MRCYTTDRPVDRLFYMKYEYYTALVINAAGSRCYDIGVHSNVYVGYMCAGKADYMYRACGRTAAFCRFILRRIGALDICCMPSM